MNIVARISAADGYRVVLPALLAVLLALAGPGEALGQNDVPKSPATDVEAPFEAQLDALHEQARKARDEKDFSRLEDLRLERLALAKDSSGKSAWIAGSKAIAEADALIQSMQYEQACTVLQKAWKPFEKPARGAAVFGDVAMKLFEATQAALAVYPEFNAVAAADLRKAVQLAADADLLLAEDTRMTQRLLDHYGIARRAQALHEHNEREVASGIVRRLLEQRQTAALVSDAGTPLLSDPGFPLVQAALAAGLAVRAVPGASALLAALCVAGLPTDRFAFEGFLPPREQAARQRLDALADKDHTLVFYESPRRVLRTLALMRESMGGERACCVARELTKLHETHYRGSLADVSQTLADDPFGALTP